MNRSTERKLRRFKEPSAPQIPEGFDRKFAAMPISLGSPAIGEAIRYAIELEFPSTEADPHGRDCVEHVSEYLAERGFKIKSVSMLIAPQKLLTSDAASQKRMIPGCQ